jgi:hypothetical protein
VVVKRLPIEQSVKQGRLLVKHVLPAVWKPIHSLWHQVIAFVFLCLAIWLGSWAVRQLHQHNPRAYLGLGLTLLLLWYGVDGFLRARKISRS